MKEKCFHIEEIAAVLELPDDDPRRRHLEECPRCSSQLVLYQQFLSAEAPAGADMAGADAHLAGIMKQAIDRRAALADTAGDTSERTGFLSWFGRLLSPRPALAGAAALLVVIVAVTVWQPWTVDEPILRKNGSTQPAPVQVITKPAEVTPDGFVLLSWQPVDSADGYILRIRTSDLSELAVFGPMTETSFKLHHTSLPDGAPRDLLWRVTALQGGDEIARSRPGTLELP